MAEEKNIIRIGFLSTAPPTDRRNWSGSIYSIYKALSDQGFDVVWLPISHTCFQRRILSILTNLYQKIFHRGYNINTSIVKSLYSAHNIKTLLSYTKVDLILAPSCINEIAFLKTQLPIIYFNDANAAQLINYNPGMFGLGYLSKKETTFVEKKALIRARAIAFSSEWAADYAVSIYGIHRKKIHIMKFGPNTSHPENIIEKNFNGQLTFVFLAAGWARKGGDIALEAFGLLRKRNHNIKFLIVGTSPPEIPKDELITVIPFLDRNQESEAKKLEDILTTAHILFVPTRSDAYGIVFCEAAANNMISVSTDTGGVSSIIEDGKTGFLLPESATAEDYATLIETNILYNRNALPQMAANARHKYEEELNWKVWGLKMKQLIETVIEKR